MRTRPLLLLACIAAIRCTTTPPELLPPPFGPDTSQPSPARLYWPTGLAMDPNGQFLLVANGNFDHAFAGGTIFALKVAKDPKNPKSDELLGQHGTVAFDPSFVFPGGAVMVGSYLGPLVLDQTATTGSEFRSAYSGSRDTNRLNGVTVTREGTLGCRTGAGSSPGPDCRNGILDLGKLVNLEGPFGIAFGTATPIGLTLPKPVMFVSALIPHLDSLSNGIANLSSPVAVLDSNNPAQLLFSALATDPFTASGIGAGPIVFDDVRRQLILGGCYVRFPGATQGGQLSSGKCLPGTGSNVLRFLGVDSGSASFSRVYDLGADLRSNDTVALELAPIDPTTGDRKLYAACRNPDLIGESVIPSDPALSPIVRRTTSLSPFPSQMHRLQRPAGSPGPDLLAITTGTLTIGQTTPSMLTIFDPAQGRVVGQVENLGDTPFAIAQLPPQDTDTSAKLFLSVFAGCRIAVVDVPYDRPWEVSAQALIGSCP
ncbi:MAG: hypothetical protein ACJ79Y_09795 [Myxococcales bacterium]